MFIYIVWSTENTPIQTPWYAVQRHSAIVIVIANRCIRNPLLRFFVITKIYGTALIVTGWWFYYRYGIWYTVNLMFCFSFTWIQTYRRKDAQFFSDFEFEQRRITVLSNVKQCISTLLHLPRRTPIRFIVMWCRVCLQTGTNLKPRMLARIAPNS